MSICSTTFNALHACRASVFAMLIAGFATASLNAAPIDPGLPGNTTFDGWENLTSSNYPGYGGFPGFGPWPGPIGSNVATSADANLNRISGGAGGGPLPLSSSIYFGSFSNVPNTYGGTLSVSDATPVASLENIVFQVEVGEANGYDFFNGVLPTLDYNSGTQDLAADLGGVINRYQNGTFLNPQTNQNEPVWVNTYLLQWDVSSLGAITDFEISFDSVEHVQLYTARLDQSDDYQAVNVTFIPEPASAVLLGLGSLVLLRRRR